MLREKNNYCYNAEKNRAWRKKSFFVSAGRMGKCKANPALRRLLAGCLCLELLFLTGQKWVEETEPIFIRREQECFLEWGGMELFQKENEGDIFGIRFVPETWEIQFYHRKEGIPVPAV